MKYYDQGGNEVSLDKLCRLEPAWAANRLRVELATLAVARDVIAGMLAEADRETVPFIAARAFLDRTKPEGKT